jgi:hypothetical protein
VGEYPTEPTKYTEENQMRIIHDVDVPMSASGGINGFGEGARAHVFACEDSPKNHPDLIPQIFGNDDVPIEIEGDPKYLIKMLEDWLNCLKGCQSEIERRNAEKL